MALKSYKTHVVRDGEYLTALAFRAGTTPESLLSLPKNSDLKAQRHPEILAPGDIVHLPDEPNDPPSLTVGDTNSYSADVPTVDVLLTLTGSDGKPIIGETFTSTPTLGPEPITSDGAGKVKLTVPIHVKMVHLEGTKPNRNFDVRIGHLDPHRDHAGLRSRLRQLGHLGDEESRLLGRPWLGGQVGEDMQAKMVARGVAAFQQSVGKATTGLADPALCAAIRDKHGC